MCRAACKICTRCETFGCAVCAAPTHQVFGRLQKAPPRRSLNHRGGDCRAPARLRPVTNLRHSEDSRACLVDYGLTGSKTACGSWCSPIYTYGYAVLYYRSTPLYAPVLRQVIWTCGICVRHLTKDANNFQICSQIFDPFSLVLSSPAGQQRLLQLTGPIVTQSPSSTGFGLRYEDITEGSKLLLSGYQSASRLSA
jgi:hypothetical protein